MSDYEIDHGIDGWPVCKDGEPMTNKEIVAELKQLQDTVKGLTDHGCVPPNWIEAEQLRQGIEEAIGMDCDDISDHLQCLLDEVVAADSLPVAVHLSNLQDEIAALKKSA